MKQFFVVASAFFIILLPAFAQSKGGKSGASGFYVEGTFIPKVVGFTDTTSFPGTPGAAKETGSGIDSKATFGYVFGGAWFVGLTANSYSLATKRSNRIGGDEGSGEQQVCRLSNTHQSGAESRSSQLSAWAGNLLV